MLDMKLIQSCLYVLDCVRIEYDASQLKVYQENYELDEEEEARREPNAEVTNWLDGQKPNEPGRYVEFTACDYFIAYWELCLRSENGNVRVLQESTDFIEDKVWSEWDCRYDD